MVICWQKYENLYLLCKSIWVKKRKAVKFNGTGDGDDTQKFRGIGVLKKVEKILKLLRVMPKCLTPKTSKVA